MKERGAFTPFSSLIMDPSLLLEDIYASYTMEDMKVRKLFKGYD
jgi:hypothetical protein